MRTNLNVGAVGSTALGVCAAWLLLAVVMVTIPLSAQPDNHQNATHPIVLWQPSQMKWPAVMPAASVTEPMIMSIEVGHVNVLLEDTKLEAVRSALGGVTGHKGDAGEFIQWLCYYGTDSGGRWVLWLESSEIDGPMIGGFQLRRVAANERLDTRCRPIKGNILKLPIALQLGMTEKQVIELLGRPTTRAGHTLIFDHEHELEIAGEPYTMMNTVGVAVQNGAVSAIEVWKSTTN